MAAPDKFEKTFPIEKEQETDFRYRACACMDLLLCTSLYIPAEDTELSHER